MDFLKTLTTGLVAILIISKSCAQESIPLTTIVKLRLIDSLGNALNRNYIYPDKAIEMARFISQKQRRKGYKEIDDPQAFANQLTKDIQRIYKDGHLLVRYDPDLEKRIRVFETGFQNDSPDWEKERRQNFFFQKTEVLSGNIGYIVFTNFADTNACSRKTVQAAFQFVANTDALILDLRNNFGGRIAMAREIANYFFNAPQRTGRSFNRITNTWTDEWAGIENGLHLTMPLYILTSKRTFSAAEGLAYNLKYLKNAVLVGDTTRGGAHITRSFALGNGFVGFIPFTRSENSVTKTDWEGTGVLPTVSVAEASALHKTQELILKNKLAVSTDTTETLKLQWLLNDLRTKGATVIVPVETLKQYTGVFEEFLVTLEDGKLYCSNMHQPGKKDLLVAIGERLFKIDAQSQVEFLVNKNGAVDSIRLLWNDGWVDVIKKSN